MTVQELLAIAGPDATILILEECDDDHDRATWRGAPIDHRVKPLLRNGYVILSANPNGPFPVRGNAADIDIVSFH